MLNLIHGGSGLIVVKQKIFSVADDVLYWLEFKKTEVE